MNPGIKGKQGALILQNWNKYAISTIPDFDSGNELLQNPNMSPMRKSLAGRRKSEDADESD